MEFLISQKTPQGEAMKVTNNILNLPNNYYLLLLASVPYAKIFLAVIISETDWCTHQLKDTATGTVRGRLEGVKIAQGEEGQDLEFKDVDEFMINDNVGQCWQLKADELTLTRIGSLFFFGEESKITLNAIHHSF